jgi:hypothetical protein
MNANTHRTAASSTAQLESALRSGATLFIGERHADRMTDHDEIERILHDHSLAWLRRERISNLG